MKIPLFREKEKKTKIEKEQAEHLALLTAGEQGSIGTFMDPKVDSACPRQEWRKIPIHGTSPHPQDRSLSEPSLLPRWFSPSTWVHVLTLTPKGSSRGVRGTGPRGGRARDQCQWDGWDGLGHERRPVKWSKRPG